MSRSSGIQYFWIAVVFGQGDRVFIEIASHNNSKLRRSETLVAEEWLSEKGANTSRTRLILVFAA